MVDKDSLKKEMESFAAVVTGDIYELIEGLFYFFQFSYHFFQ